MSDDNNIINLGKKKPGKGKKSDKGSAAPKQVDMQDVAEKAMMARAIIGDAREIYLRTVDPKADPKAQCQTAVDALNAAQAFAHVAEEFFHDAVCPGCSKDDPSDPDSPVN